MLIENSLLRIAHLFSEIFSKKSHLGGGYMKMHSIRYTALSFGLLAFTAAPAIWAASASADLSVTQKVSSTTSIVGQPITFTYTVTNNGPNSVSNASFLEDNGSTPNLVRVSSVNSSAGACVKIRPNALVSCSGIALAAGKSITIQTVEVPLVAGDYTRRGNIADQTGIPDPNSANNSASVTLNAAVAPTVTPAGGKIASPTVDLQIVGAASTGTPKPGSLFTLNYQAQNLGNIGLAQINFSVKMPVQYTPTQGSVTGTGSSSSISGNCIVDLSTAGFTTGIINCTAGPILPGDHANIVITVTAPPTADSKPITITATGTISDPVIAALETKTTNNTLTLSNVQTK
jgi:hypothetical protein